jgi:hypothetical protein
MSLVLKLLQIWDDSSTKWLDSRRRMTTVKTSVAVACLATGVQSGGHSQVNSHSNDYIISLFWKLGCVEELDLKARLRITYNNNDKWFTGLAMWFRRLDTFPQVGCSLKYSTKYTGKHGVLPLDGGVGEGIRIHGQREQYRHSRGQDEVKTFHVNKTESISITFAPSLSPHSSVNLPIFRMSNNLSVEKLHCAG